MNDISPTQHPNTRQRHLGPLLGFGLIGLGFGWLVGMAVAPVITNVIASFVSFLDPIHAL